ncbi:hypothetical protein HYX02_06005 [Candidatus Woesearchaeota archaeon]|nr:hypothetical protein [Candidatus Woesearchaeota archaeon]
MAEQVAKLKKKQWYPIIAPNQFNNVVIGETLVYEPGQMLGKTLSHSLMNLTNDSKRQNVNIHFKVTEVEGDKAKTSIIGYEIIPSSVKRFVRRNSEKMDVAFTCETADNILLRVKPLVITKADVKGSVAAKMRNNIAAFLSKTIKKMKYDEVIGDLISHKLQAAMRENFSKIYPLKVCEIRYAGIEAREKPQEIKEARIEAAQQEEVKT